MSNLNTRSKQIRLETIKLSRANGGYHFGGSFSCTEILIQMYDNVLTKDDLFVMSKGHACWPFYVLLKERGLDPILEGHPKYDPNNGVFATTGSLGHGLPSSLGIAFGKKHLNENGHVYVLMSDGECQEGTTWESLNLAKRFNLNNLTAIMDMNGIQGAGYTKDIQNIENFGKICELSGWDVKVIDGHDNDQIKESLLIRSEKPKIILANTIKGKGVSFMENKPNWHAHGLDGENLETALKELELMEA